MLKRKDKILISAIELLAKEGINGITTKNLSRKENVTEPALYRQYKSKQDILNHILEEYGSYDEKIMATILQSEMTGVESIMFYVRRYAELYQNYFELTTVMFSMDLFLYNPDSSLYMTTTFKRRLSFLQDIITQNAKEFKLLELYTVDALASLINGIIYAQVYEWRLFNMTYRLDERLMDVIKPML